MSYITTAGFSIFLRWHSPDFMATALLHRNFCVPFGCPRLLLDTGAFTFSIISSVWCTNSGNLLPTSHTFDHFQNVCWRKCNICHLYECIYCAVVTPIFLVSLYGQNLYMTRLQFAVSQTNSSTMLVCSLNNAWGWHLL